MKHVLMTGAGGQAARLLRAFLTGRYLLRLSDLHPIEGLDVAEEFSQADCANAEDMLRVTKGIEGIIHFGGFSVEGSWESILPANITGVANLYEAARRNGVRRIVFASSNHAVGFYRRDERIDHRVYPKPDSRYGVSKVFGEAVASLYADKYGVESLCIRIGNVSERPVDARRLAIWTSPRDLAQLIGIGLDHPDIRFEIVYGMSDNQRAWWDNSNAHRLGYRPLDRSEDFAAEVLAKQAPSNDARAELYQGGAFVSTEEGGDPTKKRRQASQA